MMCIYIRDFSVVSSELCKTQIYIDALHAFSWVFYDYGSHEELIQSLILELKFTRKLKYQNLEICTRIFRNLFMIFKMNFTRVNQF